MLKVKKIMESVIPYSSQVSEDDIRLFQASCDDGSMYYESEYRSDSLYCLRCNAKDETSIRGTIRCARCGNIRIRQKKYSPEYRYIRNVEMIDGFIIIKDSVIRCQETMNGLSTCAYDVACVVIQDNEIGAFENNLVRGYEETGERKWSRVKKPAPRYRGSRKNFACRIGSDAIYENDTFQIVSGSVYEASLQDMFNMIRQSSVQVEEKTTVCPEFDSDLVEYNTDDAVKLHAFMYRMENLPNSGQMSRYHGWCTSCGKYGQRLSARSMSGGTCPHCGEYTANMTNPTLHLNYFVTPQEYEDGTMVLRVDEANYQAQFIGEQICGVDPQFRFELNVLRTFYIYVMMTGKALFFNDKMEPIDKTGIPSKNGRVSVAQKCICSADQMHIMKNNKAMKRTGFLEYTENHGAMDLRYFDLLQKIPTLEMLAKMGMTALVYSMIYADDKDIPAYMKKEDQGNGIKRLTKPQMQNLIKSHCNLSKFVSYMQVAKKDPEALYDDFDWVSSMSHSRHILDILRVQIPGMTVKKIREYLEHVDEAQCCPVSESAQLWADYVRMLRDLNCDLTDKHLVFPNSLKREHDKAARKITQVKDEKLNAVFKERAAQNDRYAWENEEFKVLIPHDISELYEEGRKLSHCVGTYGRVVAEGHSVVAFIRRASAVDIPLCTIEIRQNAIVQARGMSNRPAENIPRMKTFIKEWASKKGLQYAA